MRLCHKSLLKYTEVRLLLSADELSNTINVLLLISACTQQEMMDDLNLMLRFFVFQGFGQRRHLNIN